MKRKISLTIFVVMFCPLFGCQSDQTQKHFAIEQKKTDTTIVNKSLLDDTIVPEPTLTKKNPVEIMSNELTKETPVLSKKMNVEQISEKSEKPKTIEAVFVLLFLIVTFLFIVWIFLGITK